MKIGLAVVDENNAELRRHSRLYKYLNQRRFFVAMDVSSSSSCDDNNTLSELDRVEIVILVIE